jgi:predicted phosphate transport protein (TIGR00153 family)
MSRLTNALVGRDTQYFDLFEAAATNLVRAAELLERMLADWPDSRSLSRDILVCEQEGDRITHDLIHRLNQTFVTPIDREDILQLASKMDDVADYIEEAADYFGLYKIQATTTHAQRLAEILTQSTRQICQAMPRLRDFGDLSHFTIEIHRLENDGDRVTREAIAALFETGIDPMTVIRWKDIYDRLEAAIDATETVANIIEGIVIKNA